MDISTLLTSPLARTGAREHYLRLVLAEAANFGMPGSAIVVLDDLAALLGLYEPIPEKVAAHVAGPLVAWRTHPGQPSFERIDDVEKLVYKQRALIAFGGGKPGQMVGTAEIVMAMGNIIAGTSPPDYYDVFQWASLDVLSIITGKAREEILADKSKTGWKDISDDDVLKPGGRLYETYQTIATSIRRESIAAMEKNPEHPRAYLLPFARLFLESNAKARVDAEAEGDVRMLAAIAASDRTITTMFPELANTLDAARSVEQERVSA